mmetsp:Transcript_12340/g.18705  ORF Transcript_12340/g.18705 Transcript_12340/m.18705 type:complete len:321 (+) Transcript_12340:118-1080(+)|eukprot:CAMPEP_0185019212 /NCGR_PEP_ID=MMETSP1103-20130426/1853_1 /TAXON_ID=36769 /ORGANISM="Paraphysomonas bandaiensis, Strain Caron Lab Isolate" /LENGTH=320 /DNA_ID=CAMNT_0027549411 /DNA_START=96 /DNA_END=1058 /DNA_ORIENTATION=-
MEISLPDDDFLNHIPIDLIPGDLSPLYDPECFLIDSASSSSSDGLDTFSVPLDSNSTTQQKRPSDTNNNPKKKKKKSIVNLESIDRSVYIDHVCNYFENLPEDIKNKEWTEEILFKSEQGRIYLRRDDDVKRVTIDSIPSGILPHNSRVDFSDSNSEKALAGWKERYTDIIKALCRPSEFKKVRVKHERYSIDELKQRGGLFQSLLAILTEALQELRDRNLERMNDTVDYYDGKTIFDIIKEVGYEDKLPAGIELVRRIKRDIKTAICEYMGISRDDFRRNRRWKRPSFSEFAFPLYRECEWAIAEREIRVRVKEKFGIE